MTDKTTPSVTVLGKFVDGLEVSVYGDPRWAVFEGLRAQKNALRATRGEREFGPIPGVPGGDFMLENKGGSKYQFVLHNGAISRLEVTSRGALPKVMIQFRADVLYEHDLGEMEDIAEAIASHFLAPGFETKVSSFDIALDFQSADWRWPDMEDVVCRAKKRGTDYEGKAMTGMTFGKDHNPLQVVIYDKSEEIRRHHKEWMEGVWEAKESFSGWLPVIRAELRFGRDLLKDFDVETIADLRPAMGDLIRYAVGGQTPWFRVASPETRGRRQDRREAAPWWEELRHAFLEGTPETGRVRQRAASSTPDFRRASSTAITNLVLAAAWARLMGLHPADTPEEFFDHLITEYLPPWLENKELLSWEDAVNSRVEKILSSGKATPSSTLAD